MIRQHHVYLCRVGERRYATWHGQLDCLHPRTGTGSSFSDLIREDRVSLRAAATCGFFVLVGARAPLVAGNEKFLVTSL